jgi:diguanylate cyclase (GGDEF)-like protein
LTTQPPDPAGVSTSEPDALVIAGVDEISFRPVDARAGDERLASKLMSTEDATAGVGALTGPSGRTLFLERVAYVLAELPDGRTLAVMALNLHHFSELTVSRGRATGERVLTEVARRLRKPLAPVHVVACTAGDPFVIACELTDSPTHRQALPARVISCFDVPFLVGTSPAHLSASMGVAFSTGTRDDPEQLLGSAEVARAEARRAGDNRIVVFDRRARVQVREQFEMSQTLQELSH